MANSKNEIRFSNANQVVLYECELKGQMSDGQWENSRPSNHWEIMYDAKAVVAEDLSGTGKNFRPRRKYNYADPGLVNIVGDRMIWYVKCAQAAFAFGSSRDDLFRIHHDLDYIMPDSIDKLLTARISSDDTYDQHIVKKRLELKMLFGEDLRQIADWIGSFNYSIKDLVRDLREMSRIVNSTINISEQIS